MLRLTLEEIARLTDGQLSDGCQPAQQVHGVAIDSRALRPGMLFAAFRGERVDGHDFLSAADKAGAAAALVERHVDNDLPQVLVSNVGKALRVLAGYWRQQFEIPIVGITGSNGKTTVKEMLAAIVSAAGRRALVTSGNRNNELGLPLMLLELSSDHQLAVLEMGAGQPGDIQLLAELAKPQIGVITHIGPAHLERLKNLEGVARTKAELFTGLLPGGKAIYPVASEHADILQRAAAQGEVCTFGSDQSTAADMRWREVGGTLHLSSPQAELSCRLQVPGRHNRDNAAAAAAAALALQLDPDVIATGLSSYRGYQGRLQRKAGMRGSVIIDDTYNANPGSLSAALQSLAETDTDRERWLVLGDMGELGQQSSQLHRRAGEQARESGISRLYVTGELSRHAVGGFGAGAQHYPEKSELIEALQNQLHAQISLLVKGSRAAQMEQVVNALTVVGGNSHVSLQNASNEFGRAG